MENPKFQELPGEHKDSVLNNYYDKYVVPSYQTSGFTPPDRKIWIEQIQKSKITPTDYYPTQDELSYARMYTGVKQASGEIFSGITSSGIWLHKEAALAQLGLTEFFTAPFTSGGIKKFDRESFAPQREDVEKLHEQAKQKVQKISNDMIDSATFFNQTYPSHALSAKLDTFIGEQLMQLPLYEGIGAARKLLVVKGMASVGTGLVEGAAQKGVQNLTKTLLTSKLGKFTVRRLGDAFDGLAGSTLQGQSDGQQKLSMLAFMGFGAIGEGFGYAGSNLIKKFTSETLATGGRPLQEAITAQAEHELGVEGDKDLHRLILGHDTEGREIKVISKDEQTGTFHVGEHTYDYKSKEELQQLVTKAIQQTHKADPAKTALVSGEKMSLNSMAIEEHGKPWRNLSKNQREAIRQKRANQVSETIAEFPLHQPEMAQAHIDHQLKVDVASNPELGQTIQYIEQKYGGKVSSALLESEQEDVAKMTGQKSSQGSISKVGKRIIKQTQMKSDKLAEDKELAPRKFAQVKAESLAYFRNPQPKKGGDKNFDYKGWLDGMDHRDFINELRSHMGNHWFFENPEHALIWSLQYKDQMPKAFHERVLDELDWIDPQGTPKSWAEQSRNMERHLDKLADTGRLFSEGNVFRSTNIMSWGGRTKWQHELNPEIEKRELQDLEKTLRPYKQNYPMQYQLALDITKELQRYRRSVGSAVEDADRTQSIRNVGQDIKNIIKGSK